MAALREAITNAVMHRDYFQAGANVFVEVYSDRIEVTNPGGLPKGLAPADLGTVSVRRNLLVADLLHRIGYIEKEGSELMDNPLGSLPSTIASTRSGERSVRLSSLAR